MSKNKKGKNSKNTSKSDSEIDGRLLEKDNDTEEYGLITKKLGNGRFLVKLNLREGEIIGRLCGKLRQKRNKKSNWVDVDSVVLVGIRDFQDTVVDIVHVYTPPEVRRLRNIGAFVEEFRNPETENKRHDDDECVFDFQDI